MLPRARRPEAASEGKNPGLGVGWVELPLRPAPQVGAALFLQTQTDAPGLWLQQVSRAFPEVFLTWPHGGLAPECPTL